MMDDDGYDIIQLWFKKKLKAKNEEYVGDDFHTITVHAMCTY